MRQGIYNEDRSRLSHNETHCGITIYIHIKIQLDECLITVTCVRKYSHKKSYNLMNLEYYNIKILYFISILFTNYGIN